ncbi:MAG: class I SAM-dependent methyltransferase [Christensenellales bacterium]
MEYKISLQATKEGFEKSFAEGKLYDRQTQDARHLSQIIDSLQLSPNAKVLDLGTGTGYVALAIARQYPEVQVVGLDIVNNTLAKNIERAKQEGLSNVVFLSYDGENFPFQADNFDVVVTRYALHHFPDIYAAFREISRVLKLGGQLFIADPTPNDLDITRFVDDYMKMRDDGHIKYYTLSDWQSLGQSVGLDMVDCFETSITFPRLKSTAIGFEAIKERHGQKVVDSYDVHTSDDGQYIFITERVLNVIFTKEKRNL